MDRGPFIKRYYPLFIVMISVCVIILNYNYTIVAKEIDSDSLNETDILSTKFMKRKELMIPQFMHTFYERNMIHQFPKINFLKARIFTNCNGICKTTDIPFALLTDIDVDNDTTTGKNGADISIQYLILPYIEFEPYLVLGIMFTISVDRIGEEIKDKNFTVQMMIGGNDFVIGYRSPSGSHNEIPLFSRSSLILLFNPIERIYGVKLLMKPEYSNPMENNVIELFAEYQQQETHRKLSFEFDPAIQTEFSLWSTKQQGQWLYQFKRLSNMETVLTSRFINIEQGEEKETMFVINPLPTEFSFTLELTPLTQGGGKFIYESIEMYDTELLIKTEELGICGYATIRNTPKRIKAEWLPSLENGYYTLSINSEGTDLCFKDSVIDPVINLTINNLETLGITAYWNLTNPGNFIVLRNTGLKIDLEFIIGDWIAKLNAEPEAKSLFTSWFIDNAGYLAINTNWEPFTTIDLMIKGKDLGLKTAGETFKARNFSIDWVLQPFTLPTINGYLSYKPFSLSIDLYLLGIWYHLWPLF